MNYSDFDQSPDYVVETSDKKNDRPAGPEKKIIMQLNINFNVNSVTIKSTQLDQLRQMAELMKTYPDTTAVIEGNTLQILLELPRNGSQLKGLGILGQSLAMRPLRDDGKIAGYWLSCTAMQDSLDQIRKEAVVDRSDF
jgi:hypothetical protein